MKIISERESKFESFIKRAIHELDRNVSLILIGSRASGTAHSYSDYDIIVVYQNWSEEELLKLLYSIKDKDLPIDFIMIPLEKFDLNDKLMQQMMKSYKILFDGLELFIS